MEKWWNMLIKLCLVLFLVKLSNQRRVVAPSEDFYQLLGVARTAEDQQIRRAFKKLALQYHPDKNKDDPETAQEHFQKISNAYDVLIDPQLRDIYNKEGDRGLNEYFQAQARREGEKHKEEKKEKEAKVHDTFLKNTEIVEIKENLDAISRRDRPWVVLLFAPNDIVCVQITPAFLKFAESVGSFVNVAVIDCKQEINKNLCQKEFEIYEYPAIFGIRADASQEYLRFDREITAKNLKNFAIGLMESFVLYLSQDNYEEFCQMKPDLPRMVSFKSRAVTSPLVKAISKQFLGKLIVAEVDVHLENEFAQKFSIYPTDEKPPTLIILTEPNNYQGIKYDGIWNLEQIVQFLRPWVYNPSNLQKAQQYPFQLTRRDVLASHCDINDRQLCFLLIEGPSHANLTYLVQNLRNQYQNDLAIKFFYLDSNQILEDCLFQGHTKSQTQIIIIKPNKMKYELYQGDDQLNLFIEEILGGKKLQNSLSNSLAKCIKPKN